MVCLTFYGGVGEIGGNKVLLEEGERRLLLDFGLSYKRRKLYYEEYLQPRGGAGLLDLLAMGLVPPLEGVYRDDLEMEGVWEGFRDHPLYRRVEHLDGVLLSHAHFDHSGNVSLLKGEIPVYATVRTAFLAKAIQDSGRTGFEQQVCYFSPLAPACPKGCRQEALMAAGEARQQRQFCISGTELATLGADAIAFWEKATGQKDFACRPLKAHPEGPFRVRCFPVDHSIPGAAAWGVETGSGWVIYSGDLRRHGKRGELTRRFAAEAARLRPRALIMEGTNLPKAGNVPEQSVYENALRAVARAKGLVIADFPARDIDRLLTFLQVARESGRKLAVLPRDAYMLRTMRLVEKTVPDIASDKHLVIYQDTTAKKYPETWLQGIYSDYGGKVVIAEDVRAAQSDFILSFSFFDINELPSIRPAPGGLYLYSSSEPHDEEQEIDFRRLHEWLRRFDIKGFGLPVETAGGWEIPEGERGLHASGHACGPDLLDMVAEIDPEVVIPVHTEHAALFAGKLAGRRATVVLPQEGQVIEV